MYIRMFAEPFKSLSVTYLVVTFALLVSASACSVASNLCNG